MKKNLLGLKKKVIPLFILGLLFTGLMLFLPAGTINYWQAWIFLLALFIPVFFIMTYFLKRNPGLLKRRMNFKEKEAKQKTVVKLSSLIFFAGFLIPGFDHRYGWSEVPVLLVILADIIIFLSYMLIFFVFKENSYTSRTIEVDKKQKVITTGPYAVVRHPMYVGVILMCMSIPIALGSFWALICFAPIIPLMIIRTLNEEKVLSRDLKGYKRYMQKIRYRLIPGVW